MELQLALCTAVSAQLVIRVCNSLKSRLLSAPPDSLIADHANVHGTTTCGPHGTRGHRYCFCQRRSPRIDTITSQRIPMVFRQSSKGISGTCGWQKILTHFTRRSPPFMIVHACLWGILINRVRSQQVPSPFLRHPLFTLTIPLHRVSQHLV